MKHEYNLIINSQDEMSSFAKNLSKKVTKTTSILLFGNLGSGKTFFSKSFISSLCKIEKSEITSPTFNIISEYKSGFSTVLHYDLYRIQNESELFEIGIQDEIGKSILLIEWPEIAAHFFENEKLDQIRIRIDKISEKSRKIFMLSSFNLDIKP